MLKKIISAIFILLATTTQAETASFKPDYQWFGTLHVSADYLDTNQKHASGQVNLSSNSSHLGIRGKQSFDDKFSVIWQLDSSVDVVNGDWALSRNSFLGLNGNWGVVKVGQMDTPLKSIRGKVEFFSNQVGDARNIVHLPHGQADRRFKNSILYESPEFYGFSAKAHYSANMDKGGTQDSDDKGLSAALEYQNQGFWAAIAHDKTGGATDNQQITRATASYDFGIIKIAVLYQQVRDDFKRSHAFGGGLSWQVAEKWAVKGQAYRYQSEHKANTATLAAVGTDYTYNQYLKFYLNAGAVRNSNELATPFAASRSAKPSIDLSKDPSATHAKPFGVSLGMIFKF
jgi:predicted porin